MQKIVVSDPKSGKAYNIELEDAAAKSIVGLKVGAEFDAASIGLAGYKLKITGGTDSDGFPIRPDVHGRVRPRILLRKGPGFKPTRDGLVRRKRVRGDAITPDIAQVNAVVTKSGKKAIDKILGSSDEEEKGDN